MSTVNQSNALHMLGTAGTQKPSYSMLLFGPRAASCKCLVYNLSSVAFNSVTLRMAKTLWIFGFSECNRVKFMPISNRDMYA